MSIKSSKLSPEEADSLRHLFASGTATLRAALHAINETHGGRKIAKPTLGQCEEAIRELWTDLYHVTASLLGIDVAEASRVQVHGVLDTFSDGTPVATVEFRNGQTRGWDQLVSAGLIARQPDRYPSSLKGDSIPSWTITVHDPPNGRRSLRNTKWDDLQRALMENSNAEVPQENKPAFGRRSSGGPQGRRR